MPLTNSKRDVIILIYLYTKYQEKGRVGVAEHKNSVYRNISSDIAEKIKKGVYKKGDMLEPERKLMEVYGVERTTIRRALEVLVGEGLLVKKTGLGSFVSDGKEKNPVPEKSKPVYNKASSAKKLSKLPDKVELAKDFLGAAEELVEYLYGLGHEKYAVIGVASKQLTAINGAVAAKGIKDPELFVSCESKNEIPYLFERLWRSYRAEKPSCVIVPTVDQAEKLTGGLERMGVNVPEEISVAALDVQHSETLCGCRFDVLETEKNLLEMLSFIPEDNMEKLCVNVKYRLVEGETAAKAVKKDDGRNGRAMSDYLL